MYRRKAMLLIDVAYRVAKLWRGTTSNFYKVVKSKVLTDVLDVTLTLESG